MSSGALFVAVFLACIVESVEATTIVLAVGTTRDWRSAILGVLVGLIALGVIVGGGGPALSGVPQRDLRLVVGGLLLLFGMQWLRKAVLRASGYKGLHDEVEIFDRQVAAAQTAQTRGRFAVSDWYAFTLSFKGVLLEGLEVAFIVLTFGTNQHDLPLAVLGAVAAILLVVALGFAVRAPLARVPENTMKFIVGIMLTSFGTFWGGEGAGARWPASDGALVAIILLVAAASVGAVSYLRRHRTAVAPLRVPSLSPRP